MPKLKTVKGVKDRIKRTGTGKLVSYKAGRRHLLGGKRSKTKRQMRRLQAIVRVDAKRINPLLPY